MRSPRSWDEWYGSLSATEKWSHCGSRSVHSQHEHVVVVNEGRIDAICIGTPDIVGGHVDYPPVPPAPELPGELPELETPKSTRPNWDAVWSHVAEAVSARSLCDRAKVGAAIVDWDNRIVAVGYNGPPANFDHGDRTCTSWCPRAKPPTSWNSTDRTVPHTFIHHPDGLYLQSGDPSFPGATRKHGPVDDDGMIALGYEQVEVLDPSYEDCIALHAEANALSVCDRSQRVDGALYVLGDVCYTCAKLIANSGLTQVYVARDGRDRGYRNPERSYAFMESCGVTVVIDEF